MAFKFIGIIACLAIANAIELPAYHGGYGAPAYGAPAYVKAVAPIVKYAAPIVKTVEYDSPPHYDFSYSVHDGHTGDVKSQHESRKGDVVQGQYSLIDADGYQRIVDYTSDAHNGFNAVVRREPLGHKVVAPVAKVISPIAHYGGIAKIATPIAHYGAAPIAHYGAAPIAHYGAAPVAHYGAPAHVSFAGPAHGYHY